jgi:hypothetical protein
MIDSEKKKMKTRGTQICRRGVGEVNINSEQSTSYFYSPMQFTNHAHR